MNQKNGRILFVDDDEGILFAAEILLKRHVEEIRTVSEPGQIPELLGENRYDAVFLDMNFSSGATSGNEGFEWLQSILQIEPQAVVILMTAFGDVETAVQAIKRGATDFILKPWQNEKLINAVHNAITLSRSRREQAAALAGQSSEEDESEKLHREIEYASAVQQRLLPQGPPHLETLECAAVCRAARGVGGDYYDYIAVGESRVGIALGDVSGKGVSAALLMASLQGCLQSYAPQHADAVDNLIASVNRLISTSTDSSRFITFFYGLYDDVRRQLTYVNAGHHPPLLFRTTDDGDRKLVRLQAGGMVIGIFPQSTYQKETVQLHPGDVLVLYTDGVSEAMNTQQEEFGEERLIEIIERNVSLSSQELVAAISAGIDAFSDPSVFRDDMTLMVARVT